jgi:hypothetical protein
MNNVLTFILAFAMGWWLAPALTDIVKKIREEIEEWRYK